MRATTAATAKIIVVGAMTIGALTLGTPAAQADDAVVDQTTVTQPSTGAGGDESTTERRKPRVYIIGKTTKPHARQG